MSATNTATRVSGLWAALGGWPLLLGVFYWKVLFGGQVFVFIDASRFFFPWWAWGAKVLHQGLIPLWNPDAQFGTPYFADPQTAGAYPPVFLLYSWLQPVQAFCALILLHHLWAAVGTWVWLRQQQLSTRSAFFGSFVFVFSAHVVCSSWTPPALMAISWLPWILVGAERVFGKKKGGLVWLALGWAMQLACGYPVLTYLTGLTLLLHLGLLSWKAKSRPQWIVPLSLAAFFAITYNLVWELPFLEFFRVSNYSSGPTRLQDLSWKDLKTLLDAFASGHPIEGKDPGFDYWVGTYFVGLPVLFLVLVGCFQKSFRRIDLGSLILFLVLSLGSTLGLGTWLRALLPGYALVVHSGFWLSVLVLWLALLSGQALEGWNQFSRERPWFWSLLVMALYVVVGVLKKPYFPAFFVVSFLALLAAVWMPKFRGFWVFVSLAFSLGVSAWSLNMTLDRSYYDRPPVVLAKLSEPGRLFFSPPFMVTGVRLQGTDMGAAYEGAKESLIPNWPLAYGREEAPVYDTLQLKDSFFWTFQAFEYSPKRSRNNIDFLGLRYLFGPAHFPGLKKIAESPVEIWENPSASDKWFCVPRAFPAGSDSAADMERSTREDLDLRHIVFLDGLDREMGFDPRQVKETRRTTNSVGLSTSGEGDSLLVSTETEAPGWRVWVDGQERSVLKIDHCFRGVVLGPKDKDVLFRYQPVSFRLGLFLSLLSVGTLLGLGWCSLRRG